MIKKLINICASFLFFIFKQDKRKIVFSSFPDFSDNSFALFIYVLNEQENHSVVWLVDELDEKKYHKLISNYTSNKNYILKKKKSLIGLFHFLTAGCVFHTHGIFNAFGVISGHKVVNLWHGMPLKRIGLLEDNGAKNTINSNFHLCTSTLYQDILSRAFGVTKKEVLVLGQSRNDLLLDHSRTINQVFGKNDELKTILWMPTYRKSVVGDVREDGSKNKNIDFFSKDSLVQLNDYCKNIGTLCYIKIHPMDYMSVDDFDHYSNIIIFDNDHLNEKAVQLYSIINSVDLLLTDFSSIYIDFLLLEKPIGFVFSDFKEYLDSRGFIFEDIKSIMPGKIISNTPELISFLEDIFVKRVDGFKVQRSELRKTFHDVTSDFSKNIYNTFIDESA